LPRSSSSTSAVIFAGGRATRLGGANKALLDVGGSPIIDRILRALGPLVDERLVLTNDASLGQRPGVRLVFDPEPHAGVLPALASGLSQARGALCLAVACDMPFVSQALFEHLLRVQREQDADVVIPRAGDYLEPMHAVYRREPVLAAVREALARGQQRMVSYFPSVRVVQLEESEVRRFDPDLRAFFNVNTPADLAEAQRLAAAR
jgi:molybdenum cofactor guanylyltransferase